MQQSEVFVKVQSYKFYSTETHTMDTFFFAQWESKYLKGITVPACNHKDISRQNYKVERDFKNYLLKEALKATSLQAPLHIKD